jgi:hypothetical protein
VERLRPEVVPLDGQLPDLSGFSVAREASSHAVVEPTIRSGPELVERQYRNWVKDLAHGDGS